MSWRRAGVLALTAVLIASTPALAAVVGGRVTAAGSTPILDVEVAFVVGATVVASDVTDAGGAYGVTVAPGTYDIRVTPPSASGFVPQTIFGRSIAGDTTLDIVLVGGGTIAYGGVVEDRDGTPLAGQVVQLCPELAVQCFTAVTDANGAFAIAAPPGRYRTLVVATLSRPATPGVPSASAAAELISPVFTLAANTSQTLRLEDRRLTGTVVDPDGNPVPDVTLSAGLDFAVNESALGAFTSGFLFSATTTSDATGHFELVILPGSGHVQATPPAGASVGIASVPVTVTGDTMITVALPAAVVYGGVLEDRDGTPLAGQSVQLCPETVGPCSSSVTDESGAFALGVAPGRYRKQVLATLSRSGTPTVPPATTSATLSSPVFTLAANTSETLELETRRLTGTVVDVDGNPVANVTLGAGLDFVLDGNALGAFTSGFLFSASTTSDATGHFELAIFPGAGLLQATPPAHGTVGPATVDVTVTGDTMVTVVLPAAVIYSGVVEDRDGTPLAGQSVRLCPEFSAQCLTDVTDATGGFAIGATPGRYRTVVFATLSRPDTPAVPPASTSALLSSSVFTLATNTSQTLRLETRRLTGTVVDVDGNPVPTTGLSTGRDFVLDGSALGAFTSGLLFSATTTTDAAGDFDLTLFPGSGSLRFFPEPDSGLAPFVVQGVTIAGDRQLAVLLQFVARGVNQTVGAGGTVTTDTSGSGATPSLPVQVTVTTPNAGQVTISFSPFTLPPPAGFRFLTQQIDIGPPAATPDHPLIVVFEIDASRVPGGEDETTIQMFEDRTLVPDCTGLPGTASPDPCVAGRARLADGDIRFTVLTSSAGIWNFGVAAAPPTTTTTITTSTTTTTRASTTTTSTSTSSTTEAPTTTTTSTTTTSAISSSTTTVSSTTSTTVAPGTPACETLQRSVQDGVGNEDRSRFRNHGAYVRTVSRLVAQAADVSPRCRQCIVRQFARGIAVAQQEPCRESGFLVTASPFEDFPVSATKVLLEGRAQLVFLSRDASLPVPARGTGADPTVAGWTVDVCTGNGARGSLDVPARRWSASGRATAYRVTRTGSPLTRASLRHGSLRLVAHGGRPEADGSVRSVGIRVTAGTTRICALFAPPNRRTDKPGRFVARDALAESLLDCSDAELGCGP